MGAMGDTQTLIGRGRELEQLDAALSDAIERPRPRRAHHGRAGDRQDGARADVRRARVAARSRLGVGDLLGRRRRAGVLAVDADRPRADPQRGHRDAARRPRRRGAVDRRAAPRAGGHAGLARAVVGPQRRPGALSPLRRARDAARDLGQAPAARHRARRPALVRRVLAHGARVPRSRAARPSRSSWSRRTATTRRTPARSSRRRSAASRARRCGCRWRGSAARRSPAWPPPARAGRAPPTRPASPRGS